MLNRWDLGRSRFRRGSLYGGGLGTAPGMSRASARDGGAAPTNTGIGAMGATRSMRRAARARLSFRARAIRARHLPGLRLWIRAGVLPAALEYRGGLYLGRVSLFGRGFALAQDGPKLALERRERCHQRSGFECPEPPTPSERS